LAKDETIVDSYRLEAEGIVLNVNIVSTPHEFLKLYHISTLSISPTTQVILNKIKEEFILGLSPIAKKKKEKGLPEKHLKLSEQIRKDFEHEIGGLIEKYFPHVDPKTKDMLTHYLIIQNVGYGDLELLLKDPNIEEIVINNSKEPVWIYHKRHAWLKSNVLISTERRIRHFSTMIGRDVGKDITVLNPLLDAHLRTGDRVNATLMPISSFGNTMTIRKFAEKPWTIVDFINVGTLKLESAAFVWMSMENEMSTLIAGGTGSGKTSTLNVIANFFPPNQRIISIEDTREITLPKSLHWVPLSTRNPNPEGRGGISMLDLVVNSLRMRPDRILVGEIRRKEEAEVMFEAMHTGHSVYATVHANNAAETIMRLTHPPIDIPKAVLPALSLIMIQNRNRRTGARRTLQLAEIDPTGDCQVFQQWDATKDIMKKVKDPVTTYDKLNLYTGMTKKEIGEDLKFKESVIKGLMKLKGLDVHQIGFILAKYYTQRDEFSVAKMKDYLKEAV